MAKINGTDGVATFDARFKTGKIKTVEVTSEEVQRLFKAHSYGGQRDHAKHSAKRKHTHGVLVGNSQQFSMAYCHQTKSLIAVDGYHRAHALTTGVASFAPGASIQVVVYAVDTLSDVRALYDQFNSSVAAKKARCYFESGLNELGLKNAITSPQLVKGPRNYAVQMAATMRGTSKVRDAVISLKDGLVLVNAMQLERNESTEIVGVLAAYLAIAQHCKEQKLAQDFIRGLNQRTFYARPKDRAEVQYLSIVHLDLRHRIAHYGKTGDAPNRANFDYLLGAFVQYRAKALNKKTLVTGSLNLSQFLLEIA